MAAYDSNATTTGELTTSLMLLYNRAAIFAATPELVADQVANVREDINATSVQFTTYSNLSAITAALTETEEVASVKMVDSYVTLTPAEYGNVVTRTQLIQTQSAGLVDTSAAFLVGRNMGVSLDGLAITALDGFGGTTIYPNAATLTTNIGVNDIMDKVFANRLYNKLARLNVPGLFGGMYVGIAHDDVLHDLRSDTQTGAWIDVLKYADPQTALRNEVGMFAGIRWLRSRNAMVTSDVSGTVDGYRTNVVGFNALGKAVSLAPQVRISGPFDKLSRFLNIGWYGILVYDTIDANNQVSGYSASSVGSN
jgi:N4-gp56 family major capsid protein